MLVPALATAVFTKSNFCWCMSVGHSKRQGLGGRGFWITKHLQLRDISHRHIHSRNEWHVEGISSAETEVDLLICPLTVCAEWSLHPSRRCGFAPSARISAHAIPGNPPIHRSLGFSAKAGSDQRSHFDLELVLRVQGLAVTYN
jgi:hypothetical protein